MRFTIEHLSKHFEKKEVLHDIDFSLKAAGYTDFWGATAQGRRRFLIA